MKKTIPNWKEYVIAKDFNKLESALNDDGFIDENGNLELANEAYDYAEEFWQKYSTAFSDKILDV